jgi:hypothetical protein
MSKLQACIRDETSPTFRSIPEMPPTGFRCLVTTRDRHTIVVMNPTWSDCGLAIIYRCERESIWHGCFVLLPIGLRPSDMRPIPSG